MQDLSSSHRDRVKRSRAIVLLRKLITSHGVARETIANALTVTEADIDAYLSGHEPMSLDAQGGLATFVIERVPTLRRVGHGLRAQTEAASDFHQGRTATHNASPPRS